MASVVTYNKAQLIERVYKHINDGFPGNDWSVTDKEILLYIDSAIPTALKTQMYESAKVNGVIDIPEGYLITYEFTVTNKNKNTNEWYITLPQTPLALPNGYQITDAYIASSSTGRGESILFKSAKRVGYSRNLPKPPGVFGRIEGVTVFMQATNGASILNQKVYIQLPISRTDDLNAPLNLPDDSIQYLFEYAVKQILSRYSIPKDIIEDSLPAGNKSS